MSQVFKLHPKGTPDHALENAKGIFQDVLIMGYDLDGDLAVYSSKDMSQVVNINFLVDVFKNALLTGHFETEERDGEEP